MSDEFLQLIWIQQSRVEQDPDMPHAASSKKQSSEGSEDIGGGAHLKDLKIRKEELKDYGYLDSGG